jgi:hypothetical protein
MKKTFSQNGCVLPIGINIGEKSSIKQMTVKRAVSNKKQIGNREIARGSWLGFIVRMLLLCFSKFLIQHKSFVNK